LQLRLTLVAFPSNGSRLLGNYQSAPRQGLEIGTLKAASWYGGGEWGGAEGHSRATTTNEFKCIRMQFVI